MKWLKSRGVVIKVVDDGDITEDSNNSNEKNSGSSDDYSENSE